MSKILKQTVHIREHKILKEGLNPIKLQYNYKVPTKIFFDNGTQTTAICVSCKNPLCMNFMENELNNSAFTEFPSDKTSFVCPTSALIWEKGVNTPIVDQNLCIKCGLCISRCPVGAIYLSESGAVVNNIQNNNFITVTNSNNPDICNSKMKSFENITKTGCYADESDETMVDIYNKIVTIGSSDMQFPNLLTRNLLIVLGLSCSIRRRGDVYLRMDAVLGPPGVDSGVAEIEFGREVLDSPRNILDNIAVLASRYNIDPENLTPLIVTFALPNIRTEYWRVIKDVKKVLEIDINSITIGSLILLIWNMKKLDFNTVNFYADIDNLSIRTNMEKLLERKINISNGFMSILEAGK